MRIIELDAAAWETPVDFLSALKVALRSPEWHGLNLNAFLDSMIWGGINPIEPPYLVRIVGVAKIPGAVIETIRELAEAIQEAREEHIARKGTDVDVTLIVPEFSH